MTRSKEAGSKMARPHTHADNDAVYGARARLFHWLIFALVLLMVPMGLVMTSLDSGMLQNVLFVTHELVGVTVFVLMLGRLCWRLTHALPPPSRDLSAFEVRASQTVHWLLYLVLFSMPITGYVFVVAGDYPLTYFDLADVPRLLAKNKALSDFAETAHLTLQYAVYALVAAHAGAALHHYFWRRNDVLARMLPGLRGSRD